MNQICFHNYLDGKNLCNIFANLIVRELQKESPDVKTEITVVNVRNFFIIKGRTTSSNVLNITDIISKFLSTLPINPVENLRIIDVVLYNVNFTFNPLSISNVFEKNPLHKNLQDFVNHHSNNNLYFNLILDELNSSILYDCDSKDEEQIYNLLSVKYENFSILKSDFSNLIYTSDRYYGLSMNYEKPYHILLNYIKNHVFNLGISSKLNIGVSSTNPYSEINNLNTSISLRGSKLIVKEDWLESLLLDVFPMNYKEIIEKLDLLNYDCSNEIIPNDTPLIWEKMDLSSEFILL